MSRPLLHAIVEPSTRPGEVVIVRSPAVGWYSDPPPAGTHLAAGGRIGHIRILNRDCEIVMPKGHAGCVLKSASRDPVEGVEYGQEIVALGSAASSLGDGTTPAAGDGATEPEAPDAKGLFAVRAPTDGIFYRRANPSSPSFVEVGSKVPRGATLGLVEVMKCFNYISLGGENCPASGIVERILANDTSEVRQGQTLFLIRPG